MFLTEADLRERRTAAAAMLLMFGHSSTYSVSASGNAAHAAENVSVSPS